MGQGRDAAILQPDVHRHPVPAGRIVCRGGAVRAFQAPRSGRVGGQPQQFLAVDGSLMCCCARDRRPALPRCRCRSGAHRSPPRPRRSVRHRGRTKRGPRHRRKAPASPERSACAQSTGLPRLPPCAGDDDGPLFGRIEGRDQPVEQMSGHTRHVAQQDQGAVAILRQGIKTADEGRAQTF